MTTKFEQLIEYVINDEEAKAKELFHDIVVEKSREIYENLMQEEEEDLDEAKEEDSEEEELDESAEELDETFGGDAADDLIDDVEAEEEGMQMEDEVEFDSEESSEEESGEDLEDRVVDLEDKLDELMAEFESLMGDEAGEEEHSDIDVELDSDEGGDALEMDDTAEFSDEPSMMEEAVNLAAAPKPVTTEEPGTNTKSINANNSGAVGAAAQPVKMTGDTAQGRPAPTTKDLIGKVQNSVGGKKSLSAAPKPVTAQASGVNTKTPFPKS